MNMINYFHNHNLFIQRGKMVQKDASIVKSNNLIFARYSLPYNALRFLLVASSKIEKDDSDFYEYSIEVSELVQLFGLKHGDHLYDEMERITDYLPSTLIKIPTKDGVKKYGLVSSAIYIEGEGIIQFSFHPDIKGYLLQLKENFTKYDLRNVLYLPNAYIIRLYEILKSQEFRKSFEISFLELKEVLGIPEDKYTLYGSFKSKVLLKAQKQLKEKTDITFTFEGVKTSRKVTHIRFTIKGQKKKRAITSQEKQETKSIKNVLLFERIVSYGVSEQKAIEILEQHEENHIIENLNIVDKKRKDGSIESLGGFTLDAIEKDYAKSFRAEYQQKKQQKEKNDQREKDRLENERQQAEEQTKRKEAYLDALYASVEAINPKYQDDTLDFRDTANSITRSIIKLSKAETTGYAENKITRLPFGQYLAKKYLSKEFHSQEAWEAAQDI